MAREFDLEKRTTVFAKAVSELCETLSRNPVNDRIISQFVGSSGPVGANYREAKDTHSKT